MTTTPDTDPIIIVGAGIGGLTAGLALARAGIPAEVYEQAPELGEIGAGLTIYPNAIKVLEHLGVLDAVLAHAIEPEDSGLMHYVTGEKLAPPTISRSAGGAKSAEYRIHRADLADVLAAALEAARPGSIHTGYEALSVEQDANSATVVFANGKRVTGRAVVAADGIRSRIRQQLFSDGEPRFTGYVAWRGLVPTDTLHPAALTPKSGTWVGPGHQMNRYQVRGGTLLNYVAFARQEGWTIESWTEPADMDEFRRYFEGWHPAVLSIIAATPPESCFKWALYDREPLPTWTVGRVTLLGDAAHPMLPLAGQGAGTAIEDALVFARCVDAFGIPEGLQAYDRVRVPRGAEIQKIASDSGFRMRERMPQVLEVGQETEFEKSLRLRKRDYALYDAVTVDIGG